jgi:hypothetical protein
VKRGLPSFVEFKKSHPAFESVRWVITARFKVVLSEKKSIDCIQVSGYVSNQRVTLRYSKDEFDRLFVMAEKPKVE